MLEACRRHPDVALGIIRVLARRVRSFAGLVEQLAEPLRRLLDTGRLAVPTVQEAAVVAGERDRLRQVSVVLGRAMLLASGAVACGVVANVARRAPDLIGGFLARALADLAAGSDALGANAAAAPAPVRSPDAPSSPPPVSPRSRSW